MNQTHLFLSLSLYGRKRESPRTGFTGSGFHPSHLDQKVRERRSKWMKGRRETKCLSLQSKWSNTHHVDTNNILHPLLDHSFSPLSNHSPPFTLSNHFTSVLIPKEKCWFPCMVIIIFPVIRFRSINRSESKVSTEVWKQSQNHRTKDESIHCHCRHFSINPGIKWYQNIPRITTEKFKLNGGIIQY